MKKIELIQKIKDLEGLSQDERAYLINLVNTKKKYGLVWENKPEDVEEQLRESLPVLKEIKDRAIVNDIDYPDHILIEGDNLHALTALTFTHEGMIDVIYIDPPYNTGNRSWKYNNDYVEKDDSYLHSKWLSFMDKRLRIAKKLLRKTGVLICTIDDNEHATLGLLLREIFPASEIVGVVIVHNPAGVQGKNFSYTHEFAYFVYPDEGKFIASTERDSDLVSPLRDWGGTSARKLAKTCFYPIIVKDGKIIGFGDVCAEDFHPGTANILQKDGSIYIYPVDKTGVERKWVYNRASAEKNLAQLFIKDLKGELVVMRRKSQFNYRTVWTDKKYYANIYGSKLLNSIIPTDFPFPKSLYAVKDCIKAVIHDKNNAIILDFFAGSGTTGHAVMELNDEDNGNRQAILVTNNESNICKEVTYPRLHNVIKGYKSDSKDKKEIYTKEIKLSDLKKIDTILKELDELKAKNKNEFGKFETTFEDGQLSLLGVNDIKGFKQGYTRNNLRYFQTEFISREPSLKNKKNLTRLATDLLCIKEDCYINCTKIVSGKTLNWISFFTNGQKEYLCVIHDDLKIEESLELLQKLIKEKSPSKSIKVYVFSNGQYPYTEDFEEVLPHITLCALPDAIYKAYQSVLPKRMRSNVPELEEATAHEVESVVQNNVSIDLFNPAN